jgi:Putative metallopeptidase
VTLGVLCLWTALVAAAPSFEAKRIKIEYGEPKNPAHEHVLGMLQKHRALEKMQEIFSPLQLPVDLTLRTVGCDGVSNAWYIQPTISICYEYVDEIFRNMPKETTPAGITPEDAVTGQFFYAVAHEMGHAVFDLLSIPVLGRPEDAADQFAAYVILQFGKDDARRLITGAAYAYEKYLRNPTVTAPLTAFSDAHSPPAERFYNLLCMAYGADSRLFADAVSKGYLPADRAKGCTREYGEVSYAFYKLIRPRLDRELAQQVMRKEWLPAEVDRSALK